MEELLMTNIKEQQCKSYQIPHRHKVAVPCCAEDLPSKLKKLLMPHELRKFFDKRAKFWKVYGLADVLLNPIYAQCPICAAIVSHGHCNEIMIKRDNLLQHIKSSHVEDPVRSHYRAMCKTDHLKRNNNSSHFSEQV